MCLSLAGHFSAISDDLVNSYHLLLCCLDWIYANTLISNRRDLLNPNFSGFCIFVQWYIMKTDINGVEGGLFLSFETSHPFTFCARLTAYYHTH